MIQLSIITINYNDCEGLKKSIQSVREQNFESLEYIIIDGGSSDGSVNAIKENESDIQYWVSEKDNGIYHAMNKGIDKASGEYLLFLNSGDYLIEPNSLNKVFSLRQNADILYGDLKIINGVIKYPDELNSTFFFRDSIGHPASFIKKSLFEKYGKYNEENKIVSDWEFFIKTIILNNASYKHIDNVITFYDSSGISNNPSHISNHLNERVKVLEQILQKFYPGLLDQFNNLENNLNAYKNSRTISFAKKMMESRLYKLIFQK